MKVTVLGIRGLPGVQGGIETHAERLYPRLAGLGCDVEIIVRTPFVPDATTSFGSVRLRRIWCPRRAGAEALVHSILGVLYAGMRRPDVLHIHAIGPAIVTPLARALGLRVVVTHHGPDYDRDKWGRIARWVLRTGERLGMRWSQARIVISKIIADLVLAQYGVESVLIPNGVEVHAGRIAADRLATFGLAPRRYVLLVGRLVPEKRQLDLITAFREARLPNWSLAIVGGLANDAYSDLVRQAAVRTPGVVLTGFQTGEELRQLYRHAAIFVLPSTHEGLPIAILEALSHGLPVLASDIPANLEIGLDASQYFRVGDVADLARGLERVAALPDDEGTRAARRDWVATRYDWDRIARQTLDVYRQVVRST